MTKRGTESYENSVPHFGSQIGLPNVFFRWGTE